MGKGDKKTKRGKIFGGSFGRTRPRKKTKETIVAKPAKKATKPVEKVEVKPEPVAKEAPVVKEVAEKPVAEKKAAPKPKADKAEKPKEVKPKEETKEEAVKKSAPKKAPAAKKKDEKPAEDKKEAKEEK
ncbi:MAG: 30S ribosomal protein THX [Bacteroidales bacterium]|jgi:30S ribosomal protein S31|nr:30S ribosomal protein THX [Bacteroidales bacterium]